MRNKKLLIILIPIIVILLVLSIIGIYSNFFRNSVLFDTSYRINFHIYSSMYASYLGSPSYCIDEKGVAYKSIGSSDTNYMKLGKLYPFNLDPSNLDEILGSKAKWTAHNVDAEYIRQHTVEAWKTVDRDDRLYYFLLLDNNDVFLCIGNAAPKRSISTILYLGKLGKSDIFFDYCSRLQ